MTTVPQKLAELNRELAREGDDARACYVALDPDPHFLGEWLVTITWQLPDPSDGSSTWPLGHLDGYRKRATDKLDEFAISTVSCLYRTADEMELDAKLGAKVPELV